MSKPTNLTTIRKKTFNLNNFQKSEFIFNFQLLEHIKQLFSKKNVVISDEYLNVDFNFYYFSANLFFKTKQLKFYRNNKASIQKVSNKVLQNGFPRLFNKKNFFKNINIAFNFNNLNSRLNSSFLLFFFKKLKTYSTVLFSRRFGMFIDFIKLTCLFYYSHLDLNAYVKTLSDVFKFLRKKMHAKFFTFLKLVFELLVSTSVKKKFSTKSPSLNGLKLLAGGRLKGKTMASNFITKSGETPAQTISANVNYATATAFTQNYGVFGFKMWSYRTS